MSILAAAGIGILKNAIGGVFGHALDTIRDVMAQRSNEKISQIEADAAIEKVLAETRASVETATLSAAEGMFGDFQKTARASPYVARAYVAIMVSQTFVLIWYQIGAEAFRILTGADWSMPDDAATMAVGLITLCLGGGPFVFKNGVSLSSIFRGRGS